MSWCSKRILLDLPLRLSRLRNSNAHNKFLTFGNFGRGARPFEPVRQTGRVDQTSRPRELPRIVPRHSCLEVPWSSPFGQRFSFPARACEHLGLHLLYLKSRIAKDLTQLADWNLTRGPSSISSATSCECFVICTFTFNCSSKSERSVSSLEAWALHSRLGGCMFSFPPACSTFVS